MFKESVSVSIAQIPFLLISYKRESSSFILVIVIYFALGLSLLLEGCSIFLFINGQNLMIAMKMDYGTMKKKEKH